VELDSGKVLKEISNGRRWWWIFDCILFCVFRTM